MVSWAGQFLANLSSSLVYPMVGWEYFASSFARGVAVRSESPQNGYGREPPMRAWSSPGSESKGMMSGIKRGRLQPIIRIFSK